VHGETANGPSLARGPRLDPIGETANGPSLARGPRTRVPDVPPITSPVGESLPEQLAHQMADALSRSHDFDALLHTSLLTLDESGDTPDVAELKRLLKSGIEELIAEHQTLEKISWTRAAACRPWPRTGGRWRRPSTTRARTA